MFARLRAHLTYANVASSLALFIAITGGAAFAVTQLDANSVKSKHIVNGQVKEGDLGVPANYTPMGFVDQDTSVCLSVDEWMDATNFHQEAGYYRDPFGIVHLQGAVIRCGTVSDVIFHLPPGFRPEDEVDIGGLKDQTDIHGVRIRADGELSGQPGIQPGHQLSFEGISFRCAPSGADGCP